MWRMRKMSEKKKRVYFAHPYNRWKSAREGYIEKTLVDLGYDVINPFDNEEELMRKYNINKFYEKPNVHLAGEIVELDYETLEKCDIIFAWIPKNSNPFGTVIELMWAREMKKEIIILSYRPNPFFCYLECKLFLGYYNFKNNIEYKWRE